MFPVSGVVAEPRPTDRPRGVRRIPGATRSARPTSWVAGSSPTSGAWRWAPGVPPIPVSCPAKAAHQGQAVGFVVLAELPNDDRCATMFSALVEMGHPRWALAGPLSHCSGARWGELGALPAADVSTQDHQERPDPHHHLPRQPGPGCRRLSSSCSRTTRHHGPGRASRAGPFPREPRRVWALVRMTYGPAARPDLSAMWT